MEYAWFNMNVTAMASDLQSGSSGVVDKVIAGVAACGFCLALYDLSNKFY